MKILCVSHYYPPHMGGIEIVAKNQAERLAARRHEVTVISSRVSCNETSGIENGVRVIRVSALNFLERFGVPFPIFSPAILPQLWRTIGDADVVHIHDAFYLSSFFAAVIAWMRNTPVVLMQHVAMITHPSKLVMFAEKLAYRTSGAIIFHISKKVITLNDRVEEFLRTCNVTKEKLVAIPNGVDMEVFHPGEEEEKLALRAEFGFDPMRPTVLFVGRFVPKKGFTKLLAAQGKHYQIAFLGGDRPSNVSSDNQDVVFLGKRPPRDVARVYRAADMFALPSEDEGFPLSVQEAMASGLPIITSNDPGYARYQLDRDNVILLDATDPETLKKILIALSEDKAKRARMSEYAFHYAKTHFDWGHVIGELESLYQSVT